MLQVNPNVPLARHTSLGVGGPALLWCQVSSSTVLQAVKWARCLDKPILVLGDGTNVLVSDRGWDGMVINLFVPTNEDIWVSTDYWASSRFRDRGPSQIVQVSAAASWDSVAAYCVANELQGIECLSGIPGTVGAAPVQNIGAYGQQLSDVVDSVQVVDRTDGRVRSLRRNACSFRYRSSIFNRPETRNRYIIIGIALRLHRGGTPNASHRNIAELMPKTTSLADVREAVLQVRKRKGMLAGQHRSAGSFFKNPTMPTVQFRLRFSKYPEKLDGHRWWWSVADGIRISAAALMEQVGFRKGQVHGKVGLSPTHTLAIVNLGDAMATDVVAMAREIQKAVFDRFDILLEPEVQCIGFPEYPLLT